MLIQDAQLSGPANTDEEKRRSGAHRMVRQRSGSQGSRPATFVSISPVTAWRRARNRAKGGSGPDLVDLPEYRVCT